MEIADKTLVMVNRDHAFKLRDYQLQRIDRVNTEKFDVRRLYVYRPSWQFYIYNAMDKCFSQHYRHDPDEPIVYSELRMPTRYRLMVEQLMTSTTMFSVTDTVLVIYARSLVWIYHVTNRKLTHHVPICGNSPNPLRVSITNMAIVTHHNTNVCYIQQIERDRECSDDDYHILELPSDCFIVDVYIDHHLMYIFVRSGDKVYFCEANLIFGKQGFILHWQLFEWFDDLTVCEFTLYRKTIQGYQLAECIDEDTPFEWNYQHC